MTQDVKAVSDLIAERKKERKALNKIRNQRFLRLLSIHLLIVIIVVLYTLSKAYLNQGIEVRGQVNLDKQTIESIVNQNNISILNFAPLNLSDLENHPLIKSIEVDASQMNQTLITINEFQVVGSLNDKGTLYLLENGEVVQGTKAVLEVPLISGYEGEDLVDLAESLASLKSSSLISMSEIVRHPQSFDEAYSLIYMQDGNQVSSGFKGYTVLDQYDRILKALNPDHKCLSIDELSLVAYSFPCALDNE